MGRPAYTKDGKQSSNKQTRNKSQQIIGSKGRGGAGSGFTHIRKKKAINSYKKILRKEQRDDDLYKVIKKQKLQKSGYKSDTYVKIKREIAEKKTKEEEERQQRQQEREIRAKEVEKLKAAAAEKRRQRQKLFGKKTRKGQPILHNQMALLLEKIERNVKNEVAKNQSSASNT